MPEVSILYVAEIAVLLVFAVLVFVAGFLYGWRSAVRRLLSENRDLTTMIDR